MPNGRNQDPREIARRILSGGKQEQPAQRQEAFSDEDWDDEDQGGGGGGGGATIQDNATPAMGVGPTEPLPFNRRNGEQYPSIEEIQNEPTGKMTVEEAGHLGGSTVRKLVNEGKQKEIEENGEVQTFKKNSRGGGQVGQMGQKLRSKDEDREYILSFFISNENIPMDYHEVAHYAHTPASVAWAATRDLEQLGFLKSEPKDGKKAHVWTGEALAETVIEDEEHEEREFASNYKEDPRIKKMQR